MFARANRYHASLDKIDAGLQFLDKTRERLQGQAGFSSATILVDRDSGAGMTITFWKTAEAMQASPTAATGQRTPISDAFGDPNPPDTQSFEVARQF